MAKQRKTIDFCRLLCYIKTVGLKPMVLMMEAPYGKACSRSNGKADGSSQARISKNGYERASLQTIAEKAGSSKGAIYIRYPDKESLYRSLVQPAMDDFVV